MRTVPLGAAAAQLQVTRKTLDKWLARLEITPERHPADWRYWTITDEQIQQIREARAQMPSLATVVSVARPVAPILPPLLPPRQIASTAAYTPYTPRAGDTLPADWIAFSTWARKHGLRGHERSMPPLIEQGRLPAPQTRAEGWRRHGNAIKSAYSLEQHREASRIAAARWPLHFRACDDCRAEVAPHAPDAVGLDA